jgi:hypothetical protein
MGQRRDAPPWREGALAVAIAVPGAGELEADPGLADHLHEPGAHARVPQLVSTRSRGSAL